jgi:protein-S-isoprenylcysteine O-methyltransferase Ste14
MQSPPQAQPIFCQLWYRPSAESPAVGFAAGWIGLWVVFGHAKPVAIAIVVAVVLGVHLFVIFYERANVAQEIRADYDDYCRNVGRWWPRLRGWEEPH